LDKRNDLDASDESVTVGIGLIEDALGIPATRFVLRDLPVTIRVRLHHAIGDHLGVATPIAAALLRSVAILALAGLLLSGIATLPGSSRLVSVLSEGRG